MSSATSGQRSVIVLSVCPARPRKRAPRGRRTNVFGFKVGIEPEARAGATNSFDHFGVGEARLGN